MLIPTTIFAGLDGVEIIALVFLVLLLNSFVLRLYVRLRILRQFDLADWAMVFTFILTASQCIVSIVSGRFARDFFSNGNTASILVNRKVRAIIDIGKIQS